jgi:hypothetical protein
MRNNARAGVEDITLTATGAAAYEKSLWKNENDREALAKKRLWFWVGYVPVHMSVNAELDLKFTGEIEGAGSLTVPGFTGLEAELPSGGMHLYGSQDDLEDGHFGDANASFGVLRENKFTIFDPTIVNPNFENVQTAVELEAWAQLEFIPKLSILLYGSAGPFVEPLTLSAMLKAKTARDADLACNLGFRAGVSGKVGFGIKAPFGLSDTAEFSAKLYDSCSGRSNFCPEGLTDPSSTESWLQLACYTKCLYGSCDDNAPAVEDQKFVRLKVTNIEGWTDQWFTDHDTGLLDPYGFELDSLYIQSGTNTLEPVALWDPETGQKLGSAHAKLTSQNESDKPFVCQPFWNVEPSCWGCDQADYDSGVCETTEENFSRANCLVASEYDELTCHDTDDNSVQDECGVYAFDTSGQVDAASDDRAIVFADEVVVEFDQAIKANDKIVMNRPIEAAPVPPLVRQTYFTGGPRDGTTASLECKPSGRVSVSIGDGVNANWGHHAKESDTKGFYKNQSIDVAKCDDGPSVDQACVY